MVVKPAREHAAIDTLYGNRRFRARGRRARERIAAALRLSANVGNDRHVLTRAVRKRVFGEDESLRAGGLVDDALDGKAEQIRTHRRTRPSRDVVPQRGTGGGRMEKTARKRGELELHGETSRDRQC